MQAKPIFPAFMRTIAPRADWLWRHYSVRETTDDAQIDGHINPIAAKIGGTAQTVYVKDNQEVKAGALLVKIDPSDYQVGLPPRQHSWRGIDRFIPTPLAPMSIPTTSSRRFGSTGFAVP